MQSNFFVVSFLYRLFSQATWGFALLCSLAGSWTWVRWCGERLDGDALSRSLARSLAQPPDRFQARDWKQACKQAVKLESGRRIRSYILSPCSRWSQVTPKHVLPVFVSRNKKNLRLSLCMFLDVQVTCGHTDFSVFWSLFIKNKLLNQNNYPTLNSLNSRWR